MMEEESSFAESQVSCARCWAPKLWEVPHNDCLESILQYSWEAVPARCESSRPPSQPELGAFPRDHVLHHISKAHMMLRKDDAHALKVLWSFSLRNGNQLQTVRSRR